MATLELGYNRPVAYTFDHPVNSYKRHFAWISPDLVVIYDRVMLNSSRATAYRFRAVGATAPTVTQAQGLVRSTSDGAGNYQMLTRVMIPSATAFNFQVVNENSWSTQVENWMVPLEERHFQVTANRSTAALAHTWMVLHHISGAAASQTTLNSATTFTGTGGGVTWDGVFVLNNVFLFAQTETLGNAISYALANTGGATLFHLIADMQPGCYQITVDGTTQGN